MLSIRLQRVGRRNKPFYKIIVVEKTSGPKSGKFVEKVGFYDPIQKNRVINGERVKYWISVGAQVSDTLNNFLVSEKIIEGKKINVLPKKTVQKKASDEKDTSVDTKKLETDSGDGDTDVESKPVEKVDNDTEGTDESKAEGKDESKAEDTSDKTDIDKGGTNN